MKKLGCHLRFCSNLFLYVALTFTTSAVGDSLDSQEHEVINIAALIAMHCNAKNQTPPCGPLRTGGFEEFVAMLFATTKVNEDEELLPGVNLHAKIDDTCGSVELATNESLGYTVINHQSMYDCFDGNDSDYKKPITAIIGERTSDVSRAVTNLAGLFHIPVISYGATSSSLSGLEYFTRTITPDTYLTQALIDVLKTFRWNYIIVLYSHGEYGRFAFDSFRERLRQEEAIICTAVAEELSEDAAVDMETWAKMHREKDRTKVAVLFVVYKDFKRFLLRGREKYDVDEYIWLSDNTWNDQKDSLTYMLKHAFSIIPNQIFIHEFAEFFDDTVRNWHFNSNSTYNKLFKEYRCYVEAEQLTKSSLNNSNMCVIWGSSEVSYVIDAVYTVAWALHDILNCNNKTGCRKYQIKNVRNGQLLEAIRNSQFSNLWTKNNVSFTRNGNPRNVKYSIVSFKHDVECFTNIGQWNCEVDDSENCKGNLMLPEELKLEMGSFLGVCGEVCPAGKYKLLDKYSPSCCWQCTNCTGNSYSSTPGSTSCTKCDDDEWPTESRTNCSKVKPFTRSFSASPASIILMCVNIVGIKALVAFVLVIIKYRKSKMKIFMDRPLCYLLLLGILLCNIISIIVLTDTHREHCLLMAVLSRIGPTCILGTIFIMTNDAYRTYKKKLLHKDNSRFRSERLKMIAVIFVVIIDLSLLWIGKNYEENDRTLPKTVYIVTESSNTAYVHCGFLIDHLKGEMFTVLEISFHWGLLILCTHQGYLTRKVTDNAHGLRYVFFGFLTLSINSMTMVLAQLFTDNKGNTKELIFSFYISFFATVAMACILIPKVQILIFHPEKDALFDAVRANTKLDQDSMISTGSGQRAKSQEQTQELADLSIT